MVEPDAVCGQARKDGQTEPINGKQGVPNHCLAHSGKIDGTPCIWGAFHFGLGLFP